MTPATLAVLQERLDNVIERLGGLEADMRTLRTKLEKHCTADAVARARGLFWQGVIVALFAFAGAVLSKLIG